MPPMPAPSTDFFDLAVGFIFGGGLLAVGRYVFDLVQAKRKARADDRIADREDRMEPVDQAQAYAELAEKLTALAAASVDEAHKSAEKARAETREVRAELREFKAQALDHLFDVHEWIEAGYPPPPPARPEWLPWQRPHPKV